MHMTGLQGKALWGNNLQWVKLGLESVESLCKFVVGMGFEPIATER